MSAEHPLSAWLKSRPVKITRSDFARSIGISPSHLTLVLKGRRGLSIGVVNRIEEATAQAVTYRDLSRPVERVPA